jgi:hypothetical protein
MSAPNSYRGVYYVSPECIASFKECRRIVIRQIERATEVRYIVHWSQQPQAVIQAWCTLQDDPPLPEHVCAHDVQSDRLTHRERYAILKDERAFPAVHGPFRDYGKTKERLEYLLWRSMPQLCGITGNIESIHDATGYDGSKPREWWIVQWTPYGGLLYVNGSIERLIQWCKDDFQKIRNRRGMGSPPSSPIHGKTSSLASMV